MKKIKFIVIFMLLILIPLMLIKAVDNYFSERTNEFLEQDVTFAASDIFSAASLEVAAVSSEENFIKYKYDDKKNIIGAYVDTIVVNKILALAGVAYWDPVQSLYPFSNIPLVAVVFTAPHPLADISFTDINLTKYSPSIPWVFSSNIPIIWYISSLNHT